MMAHIHLVLLAIFCTTYAFEDKSVVKWLVDNGYSRMVSYLRTSGLDVELSASGTFTVFAPGDNVFHKLGPGMHSSLHADPVELRRVMEYHVVKQFILIPLITGYLSAETMLAGQYITLHKISDKEAMINNGTRILSPNGIICNNGVIQPTDGLLSVPMATHADLNLAQLLIRDDARFRVFILGLMETGLFPILLTGDYTLIAPTNDAFAQLGTLFTDPGVTRPSGAALEEIMKYYIVPGGRDMASLRSGHDLYSLNGHKINVTVTGSADIMINDAHVIDSEILASNGVIYVIDRLIGADGIHP